jgi:hypothetical protein
MTPVTQSLTVWRNARYVEEFHFTAPVPGNDDYPYDLTGWTGALQVRQYGAAASSLLSLANVTSDTQGVWIIEPSQGIVRVRIDESALATLWTTAGGVDGTEPNEPYKLKYDLLMTPPSGGDEVWIQGDFLLYPGVTV